MLRSPSLGVFDVGLILRRLDWLLMLAVVTLVGYGLWGDRRHHALRRSREARTTS